MLAYLLVKTGVILILVSSHDTLRLVCINVKKTFKNIMLLKVKTRLVKEEWTESGKIEL